MHTPILRRRPSPVRLRKSGAYILLTYACDWVVGFFKENGYTVRGTLEDYPKGHCAYELQKLL